MDNKIVVRRKVFHVHSDNVVLIGVEPPNTWNQARLLRAGRKIRAGDLVYIGADGRAYPMINRPS